ncbi:rhomboid family intramembrane serine protease [Treponema sp.]|uniref:rhomboid family intramembrane serine protease n=1 Tax=Treponema sp. TaxID=166 RepID=UPI0025E8C515|nr:rhomboid family intramembrane serine protease [Treponema sp.]MCR5217262.1 rhomboid family intramembrane serine protease [Treponema sp.]
MAKKSRLRFKYDSPVVSTFVIICTLLFLADIFIAKGKLISSFLTCPGTKESGGLAAFNFKKAFDYVKIFTHIFGNSGWETLFVNFAFILVSGPVYEEKYGSVYILIMCLASGIISGVLNACMSPFASTGAASIVFTMIFLSMITAFSKKTFSLSSLLILLLYIGYEFYCVINISAADGVKMNALLLVPVLADLIAGICGSLFGFMASPKKKSPSSAKTILQEKEKYPSSSYSSDETVVGTLN